MIKQNQKISTAHLEGKEKEKLKAVKELLNTPEDKLFNSSEFNFSNAGLKYKVIDRKKINIPKSELIENSFSAFSKHHNVISINEFNELKLELIKLPFDEYPVILLFEELYIDYGIYHILHFIKDTKYIIKHFDDKKRYFYSTYKTKVLNSQIKLMEDIKTNIFLYPKSEFDIDVFKTKDKLLQYVKENYNSIFAWNSFSANMNTNGMLKDEVLNQVLDDFKNNLNAINTTKKDAVKSLAILLYKMYDMYVNEQEDYEITIENILRICFQKEVKEINKNKKVEEEYLDTFKISSKEYKKNSYISSVFDGINIYGINDENKYFYFYKMAEEEVMKIYSIWTQKVLQNKGEISTNSAYDEFLHKQLENPHQFMYTRQYPEFFTKDSVTILDQMATIFKEMKKSAPDKLLQKD
ncbi:MAG: hypothetical protein AB7D34_05450 [Sulfurimonas sp.]